MIAGHDTLRRMYVRASNRLLDRRSGLGFKVLGHLGLDMGPPDAALGPDSDPALIRAETQRLERMLLAWLALHELFLGVGSILPRRDGTFDFSRGEGGQGAILLFLAERAGDLIVGSPVDDWANEAARKVQSDAFPGPLWLGGPDDAGWLADLPTHEFVDCVAWGFEAPARVWRRNGLVDAVWQFSGAEDAALDLYTLPREWLAAWFDRAADMDDYRIARSMGLGVGGHGPAAAASLVLDPGAIDWTRWRDGPLGLDGARVARVHDSEALAGRIEDAQRRAPPVAYPPPATVLVPRPDGVAA